MTHARFCKGIHTCINEEFTLSKIGRIKVKNVERWEPSVREKELLRRTWSDDFDFLYDLGSTIYCYIFEHNPNCKQLFPQLTKYGDNFKESREFRTQALKFVQVKIQLLFFFS
ncbi:hypothetical protein COOONC_22085 [Cooperia oncophora]